MKQPRTLIKGGTVVNRGERFKGSLLINGERIEKIFREGEPLPEVEVIIEAKGKLILPGVIDDQVHFREPGATHKGSIASESAAAVLGGVTSYMDMPNNNPPATTIASLEEKAAIAEESSWANYSFYLGATNDNIEEIKRLNKREWCGVKVFMGASTGNMLVDNQQALNSIFKESPTLIATHCEWEPIVRENSAKAVERWGEGIPIEEHPNIRSREACIASSKQAIELALTYSSQLHILHISTAEEVELLKRAKEKSQTISGEACVHFLLFDKSHYSQLGTLIKCNPAIKLPSDREAIIKGVKLGVIEVVATDHAPHTLEEKQQNYLEAPSGLPLVQHSLQIMLSLEREGRFTIEEVVERLSHAPAKLFKIEERGALEEGYWADIVIIDRELQDSHSTDKPAYKCGWSPLKGVTFEDSITDTFVNGVRVVKEGQLSASPAGKKLTFNR